MKASQIPALLSPSRWAMVGVIAIVALVAVWWVFTEPGRARERAAQAEAASAFSQARAGASTDAARILDGAHAADTASEALSRETADVIHHAPGADQRLDRELNRIARERLCLRAAYRDRPECVQFAYRAQPSG